MIAAFVAILLANTAGAVFHCGAVERPGIAERGADGQWRGRAVETCAQAAKAAAGPTATVAFHGYKGDFSAAQADDIAFLTPSELAAVTGAGQRRRSGPAVGDATQILLAPASAPFKRREDLVGRLVCFLVGSEAEDALDAWASREAVAIERLAFQEPDEMHDAYASGKCAAMAVDLAVEGSDPAVAPFSSQPLGAPLRQEPVLATMPPGPRQTPE